MNPRTTYLKSPVKLIPILTCVTVYKLMVGMESII